jgi:hypothetical protein
MFGIQILYVLLAHGATTTLIKVNGFPTGSSTPPEVLLGMAIIFLALAYGTARLIIQGWQQLTKTVMDQSPLETTLPSSPQSKAVMLLFANYILWTIEIMLFDLYKPLAAEPIVRLIFILASIFLIRFTYVTCSYLIPATLCGHQTSGLLKRYFWKDVNTHSSVFLAANAPQAHPNGMRNPLIKMIDTRKLGVMMPLLLFLITLMGAMLLKDRPLTHHAVYLLILVLIPCSSIWLVNISALAFSQAYKQRFEENDKIQGL